MNVFIAEGDTHSRVQAKKELCLDTLRDFIDIMACGGGSIEDSLGDEYYTWKIPNEIFESVEDILEKRFKLNIYYF